MNKAIGYGDFLGMCASGLCMLHCLCAPLIVVLLPMAAAEYASESLHQLLVGLAVLPVLAALIPGALLHGRLSALALGGSGLGILALAVFSIGPAYGEAMETGAVIIGGSALFFAHVKNRQACRYCAACAASGLRQESRDELR